MCRKRHRTDRHHVVPRSRCAGLKINPERKGNVVWVNAEAHQTYHKLFGNMTPREILIYLVEEWWGGDKDVLNIGR